MDISKLPRLSKTDQPSAPAEAGGSADAPADVSVTTPSAATTWCTRCSAPNPAGTRFCGSCGAELTPDASGAFSAGRIDVQPGIGAEVWVSAIVGIVMMLIGMSFAKWALTTMFGGTYDTDLTWGAPVPGQPNQHPEGAPIGYWELSGFTALQDCGLFLFGFAMVLEAVVLLVVHSQVRFKRPLLAFALTITFVATILNLVVSAKLFSAGVLPLMSLLAVGFGGYIAAYEWRLFQYFGRPARAAYR